MKRLRRLRSESFIRSLTQDIRLLPTDFIYPIFVSDEATVCTPILSMPGCYRYGIHSLLKAITPLHQAGLQAIALFPYIANSQKSRLAEESYNPDGLIPCAIRKIKEAFPQLGVIADVALDPYTLSGQDGITNESGEVLNDETVSVLVKQALVCAQAGADVVAPSDMMDGRVAAIRAVLESQKLLNTKILSYSAKYASACYGPFREAIGSAQHGKVIDKRTYQLNPANQREGIRHIQRDIEEGADLIMVKPAMMYLDIIHQAKKETDVPLVAYQVSGEYSMLLQSVQNNTLKDGIIEESLIAIKRAGADMIMSYFVPIIFETKGWLKNKL